jgi:hypothetical protein
MVIAFAGRRIDPADSTEICFPPAAIAGVAQQIEAALQHLSASVLVSSAACGADILALEAAARLRIRSRVVLPLSRKDFRARSVADRPGNWGERYDRLLNAADSRGDLVLLDLHDHSSEIWNAASDRILRDAVAIAEEAEDPARALIVWNGRRRRTRPDATDYFRRAAIAQGLELTEIQTIPVTRSAR